MLAAFMDQCKAARVADVPNKRDECFRPLVSNLLLNPSVRELIFGYLRYRNEIELQMILTPAVELPAWSTHPLLDL